MAMWLTLKMICYTIHSNVWPCRFLFKLTNCPPAQPADCHSLFIGYKLFIHYNTNASYSGHGYNIPGLKIIFRPWPVMLTSQSNFSSVTSHFWGVKIIFKKKLDNVCLIKPTNIICLFQSFKDLLLNSPNTMKSLKLNQT